MPDVDHYWKKLVSNCLRYFQGQGNADAIFVIKHAKLGVELNDQLGNVKYWDIVFLMRYKDYQYIEDKKVDIENDITNYVDSIHKDDQNCIANVLINQEIELYIDWNAILPITKDQAIELIKEEQEMLMKVSTGELLFKKEGMEERFHKLHQKNLQISQQAGFDYPIKECSLAEWWDNISSIPTYAKRRTHITHIFSELLKTLNESDDNSEDINFQSIATKSNSIQKAVDDAEGFIREGKYDSAFDRVHTAFHGYLRQVISKHGIGYSSSDSLPALFSKLHSFYGSAITPADVGERIKSILRSASGMINAVNELRNNNTVSHPNGQLIQAREAQLAIRLVRAIVDYIEDIERTI